MAFLSIIRRWALREQLSIREIARRTKLSRNTIRKYLRSGAAEPEFRVAERPSKLDPFAAKLSGWLKTEAGKSRKQRRTSKQLHDDLVKRMRRFCPIDFVVAARRFIGPTARGDLVGESRTRSF